MPAGYLGEKEAPKKYMVGRDCIQSIERLAKSDEGMDPSSILGPSSLLETGLHGASGQEEGRHLRLLGAVAGTHQWQHSSTCWNSHC